MGMVLVATSAFPAPPKRHDVRLVLLDRDGVVNEDVGSPGVLCPSQLRLTPNAADAIGRLCRAHFKVAIITNQSCVGKGLISEQKLDEIHQKLISMLQEHDKDAVWDNMYICMSTMAENDPRMKPSPGMIVEACGDFSVKPSECVFVGDTAGDLQAAKSAGVPYRVLVATGKIDPLYSRRSTPERCLYICLVF